MKKAKETQFDQTYAAQEMAFVVDGAALTYMLDKVRDALLDDTALNDTAQDDTLQ